MIKFRYQNPDINKLSKWYFQAAYDTGSKVRIWQRILKWVVFRIKRRSYRFRCVDVFGIVHCTSFSIRSHFCAHLNGVCGRQLFVESSAKQILQSQKPLKFTMAKHPALLLHIFGCVYVICLLLFFLEIQSQWNEISNIVPQIHGRWTVNCERLNCDKSASNRIHHIAMHECQTDE